MGDLPDFITGVQTGIMQAASLVNGADAAKSAHPAVGDVYLATDTRKLYICVAAGGWTGFDASILIQGILTLYADLAGGGFEIKNIKDPTAAQSVATAAYVLGLLTGYLDLTHETDTTGIHGVGASTIDSVADRDTAIGAEATARAAADALRLLLTGGTMSGAIAMGTNKITGLGDPAAAQDAATQAYVLAQKALCLLLTGGTMSGPIAMGGSKITGLGAPAAAADAARKTDVDALAGAFDDVSQTQPSRSMGTIYQNGSKIRVIAVILHLTENYGVSFKVGAGSPPTTKVAQSYVDLADTEDIVVQFTSIILPDYYYRLVDDGGGGSVSITEWTEWDLH